MEAEELKRRVLVEFERRNQELHQKREQHFSKDWYPEMLRDWESIANEHRMSFPSIIEIIKAVAV